MIQAITYKGTDTRYRGELIEQYSFHDVRALDEYDINVIDISDENMWFNKGINKDSLDCIADLKSLSVMIDNSRMTRIIIIFPQNIQYHYYYAAHQYDGRKYYGFSDELKNMLEALTRTILKNLYEPLSRITLQYENTKTKVNSTDISASFYFEHIDSQVLLSMRSNKATFVKKGKVWLTSLNISGYEMLISCLRSTGILVNKEEAPEWILNMRMFDDAQQQKIIEVCEDKIKEEQNKINEAKENLALNNKLKSVLYTTGEELVDVVFEILEEMLGCDLSQFVDLKKEDFLFTIEDITFIGEIKGVNHNVKSQNVTQLEVHYQDYLDEHEEAQEEKVKALLIMNYQKSKPIQEREPIMEKQINLAKRNGSLIMDTYTLLQMLEKYRQGAMSREEIIKQLKETTGLLSI